MKYTEWLETLTGQQIRALAIQAGFLDVMFAPLGNVMNGLINNGKASKRAQEIFKDTYGKETSVQE